MNWASATIFTVGHSTRSTEEFLTLLLAYRCRVLADVRSFPASRRYPHFNRDQLAIALEEVNMTYAHFPRLGGRRRGSEAASPNGGWKNESFRAYADYMLTHEFEEGLADLAAFIGSGPTVLMCAEAVPWRCHRSLIADALLVRGATPVHILGLKRADPHRLTSFAQVDGHRITYPPPTTGLP
jgi:uncharacterized protein (DUF488 family)